jgi:hypothetical protein
MNERVLAVHVVSCEWQLTSGVPAQDFFAARYCSGAG